MTDAPERILAEMTAYDFPGYSPAWVWHNPEGMEDGPGSDDATTCEYIRADIHAAELATLRAEIARLTGERGAVESLIAAGDVVRDGLKEFAHVEGGYADRAIEAWDVALRAFEVPL